MNILRSQRVAALIQMELSKLILKEIELPLGVLATIVSIEVDKKMDRALIGVSVIPETKKEEVLVRFEKAAGYLQHLLLKKINIKPMPRIIFIYDKGPENAARVEKLLMGE